METSSTKVKKTSPKTFQSIGPHLEGTKTKEGHREEQMDSLAVPTFYSAEERPPGRSTDTGSFPAKHIYIMPHLQDAQHPRSQVSSPKRILDHLSGSSGRILAHSNSSQEETLLGIQISRPELAVSLPALRVERGPTGLHKGDVTCGESSGRGRDLVLAISGRSIADRTNKRRVCSGLPEGPINHKKLRLTSERKEVTADSRSRVRMAWNKMGPSHIYSSSSRSKTSLPSRRSKVNHNIKILYKKSGNENTGSLQLDRPERPKCSPSHIHNKTNLEILLKKAPRHTNSNSKEYEDATLRVDQHKIIPTTTGMSNARLGHTDGRKSSWMGSASEPNLIQRKIRPIHAIFHQHQGTSNHLVRTPVSLTEEYSNSSSVRQLLSHTRAEKRRIYDVSSLLIGRANLEEGNITQLDTKSVSYRGDVQRPRRSAQQRYYTLHRVEPQRSRFSENSKNESSLASGLICNEAQQETRNVCVPLSGPHSSSSECTNHIMGQVGSPVHVPTNTIDFEGFEPTDPILIRECNTYYTRYTNETMVYDTTTKGSTLEPIRGYTPTTSSRQNGSPIKHYKTSRVAVIKTAYETKFQSCQQTIGLLAAPIRQSSVNDYQIKWKKFCTYLTERNIPPDQLSLGNVLDFFTYLFKTRKLRPNTVAHYRSALAVPLELGFRINLHDPAVSHQMRAMQIQCPSTPVTAPKWDLNKVLLYIEEWPNKIALENLLQKTAFLLLLATGYRKSELHACVRSSEFCSISKDLTLSIRPHSSFLAKNECPQKRWPHKNIPVLRLLDGSISKLCPVSTLAEYLNRTSRIRSGNLFVHPSTQKPLDKEQLGDLIRKLIRKADPGNHVKPHDVRKYSSSCSFAETMDMSGVINALHWKSPQTFFKHYMCPTRKLSVATTLAQTQVTQPREQESSQSTTTPNGEVVHNQ